MVTADNETPYRRKELAKTHLELTRDYASGNRQTESARMIRDIESGITFNGFKSKYVPNLNRFVIDELEEMLRHMW